LKFLLDTHVFLWLNHQPERLSPAVQALCAAGEHDFYLSIVSAWEMQIKSQLGKLSMAMPVKELVDRSCGANDIQVLPVTLEHVDALSQLPDLHKDPFDRLLIAQAMHEGLTLLSADQAIAAYPAPVVW